MSTRFGVGFSEELDSRTAGAAAAGAAVANAGGGLPALVMLFATSRHDPRELRDGVRQAVGEHARLIGGYAVGIITADDLAYDGYQVGIAVMVSDEVRAELFMESPLAGNEEALGLALGRQLAAASAADASNLLLFYDSVKRQSGRFELNMATPLLRGMRQALPVLPPTAGAGLVGDMQCRETYQWFDDRIVQQSVLAVMLSGPIQMHSVVIHGCKPASDYHTITKADGATVLEIDERPALELIGDLLGNEAGISWRDYSFFVTLGVNRGDRYSYDEDNYINRLCLRADTQRKGLVMFEPDLQAGSRVQLMRRSVDMGYVRERAEALLAKLAGRELLFALYIDCAGRAGTYAGTEEEEAAQLQRALKGRVPLLGLYSGVELGMVRGTVQTLDWSGVLCIFSR